MQNMQALGEMERKKSLSEFMAERWSSMPNKSPVPFVTWSSVTFFFIIFSFKILASKSGKCCLAKRLNKLLRSAATVRYKYISFFLSTFDQS